MRYPERIRRLRNFDYCSPRSYFVTFGAKHGAQVFHDPVAATVARDTILDFRERGWYALFAFCIMPNHIHLVVKLLGGERKLSKVVGVLKSAIRLRCTDQQRSILWREGYYDRIVRDYETSGQYVRYTLQNPVRAGLVKQFDDYPFSGIVDQWF
jgi:REP element-mobilizing transposase RayT